MKFVDLLEKINVDEELILCNKLFGEIDMATVYCFLNQSEYKQFLEVDVLDVSVTLDFGMSPVLVVKIDSI